MEFTYNLYDRLEKASIMPDEQLIVFPPFCLDPSTERLWCDAQRIELRRKTFAVLHYLAQHHERLVTKQELFDVVWGGTRVGEVVLRNSIQEIRRALDDDPRQPRYVETIRGRGYRFVAVTSTVQAQESRSHPAGTLSISSLCPFGHFVGREVELARLHDIFDSASQGERQIVFVSGEAGIGKTALVDAFGGQIAGHGESWGESWVGRGQCVEHYGAGEAYLPILDALGRLCRGTDGAHFITLLSQYAPSWLAQMPALLSPSECEQLQRRLSNVTQERMLRELAEAFEIVSAERPMVLVLEDLQWGDYATLDCLSFLAPRRERARLMVLVTFRTEGTQGNGHPLQAIQQELQAHRHCVDLPLPGLSEAAVGAYLAARLADQDEMDELDALKPEQLRHQMHRRTEGNPLFLVNMVDHLLARHRTQQQTGNGASPHSNSIEQVEQIASEIPESVHQLIEKQATQLSIEHQRLLEAASGAGMEFSAATVAAGLGQSVEQVEEGCRQLVRRTQFLRVRGEEEWPDGTLAGRYTFIHALYREVLYARLSPGFRRQLHQDIGGRLERGYGSQVSDHAAELATHFERARDYQRTVRYLDQAAQNAFARHAYRDASGYVKKALQWLPFLPDTPERAYQEGTLQTLLGIALEVIEGSASAQVVSAYTRAQELCGEESDARQRGVILMGLFTTYMAQGESESARQVARELFLLAHQTQEPLSLALAHILLGVDAYVRGALSPARTHFEQTTYNGSWAEFVLVHAPRLSHLALTLLWLGYSEQADRTMQKACLLTQEPEVGEEAQKQQEQQEGQEQQGRQEQIDPFFKGLTQCYKSWLYYFRGEVQPTAVWAARTLAMATDQDLVTWKTQALALHGWALTAQGQTAQGIDQLNQSLDSARSMGHVAMQPGLLGLLAEAYIHAGQPEKGLPLATQAVTAAHQCGQTLHAGYCLVVQGKTLLAQNHTGQVAQLNGVASEAETCFRQALDIARQHEAKSLELQAGIQLGRVWQQHNKTHQAYTMLDEIYSWFTEGFDVPALKEARALLAEWSEKRLARQETAG